MEELKKVAIIGGKRIPFARSYGAYHDDNIQKMLTASVKGVVEAYNLQGKELGLVTTGAVLKSSRMPNISREVVIDAGLSLHTPAYDVQFACGTSMLAAANVANQIALGQIETAIAGGVDSGSVVPMEMRESFSKKLVKLSRARSVAAKIKTIASLKPKDLLPKIPGITEPRTGKSMGEHCEEMAKTWNISREDQDALALASHQNAAKAYQENFFDDLIVPFLDNKKDNNLRANSTLEQLAKLSPAFDRKSGQGTLTAGNSTPLTDGASAAFLCSDDYAQKNNLKPLAYLKDTELAGVNFLEEEGLLMAPAYAVPKLLKRHNLTFNDFDFFEIHEAFAAQVLCTLKAWEDEVFCKEKLGLDKALGSIDRSKLNVKGSSLALGHPFAATGTRILATAAKLLDQKGSGRALISICTAGGMGIAAIVEK